MGKGNESCVFLKTQAWQACGLVACTFFYFLLFAQFALLHRIEELDADKVWLQPVMLLMGGGGLLGSFLGWRFFSPQALKRLLALGFLLCSVLAFAAGSLEGVKLFLGIGFGVGVFLGMLTVAVVPSLRLLVHPRRIGLVAGWGTGLAYFASNVPALFQQSAAAQCSVAGVVGLLGLLVAVSLPRFLDESRLADSAKGGELRPALWLLVLLFFVLVWLDSAAFYAIQETDGLKDQTWGTPARLWGNAGIHLLFGVFSGCALDRGFLKSVLGGAMICLIGGCLWLRLGYESLAWLGAGVYVAGVSLYSTGLVSVLAKRGERVGAWTIAKSAALLFAVAGWVGSGLGVGMARDLGTVPYAFLAIASLLAAAVLILMRSKEKGVSV